MISPCSGRARSAVGCTDEQSHSRNMSLWLVAPLVSFAITVAALPALLALAGSRLPLDHPNERSLHERPMPRIGGVALMAGVLLAAATVLSLPAWLVIAAALALVSFIDDWRGLPILIRLAAHAAAAAAFLYLAIENVPWYLVGALFLGIVWMTNLYNFMDGSDGLAGGMAFFGFGGYALAAWWGGQTELAGPFACVALASAGFLLFNFPPARVFLGDAGSIPLGFLAAACGITGWQRELWPLWFPLLVFSPFAVDATLTLARRLLRGERFWEAHHDHYYQRLVRMGWGHRRTALAEYGLMIACTAAGLSGVALGKGAVLPLLTGIVLFYALAIAWLQRAWRAKQGGGRSA